MDCKRSIYSFNKLILLFAIAILSNCAKPIDDDNLLLLLHQAIDNDQIAVTQTDNNTIVAESGGSDTIQFVLRRQPTDNVSLSILDDIQTNIDLSSMTFTAENWNTAQTLTITAEDDTIQENNHTGIISWVSNSPDAIFSGTTSSLTVNVSDNDYPCSGKYIFITQSTYDGNLGGVAGADAKCNSDANKPNSGTYKAMLVGTTRRASTTANAGDGQLDWVMAASTTYYRSDCSTQILTTDANAILNFGTLSNSLANLSTSYWTGLNTDWTTPNTTASASGRCCNSWNSNSSTPRGYVGSSISTSVTSINDTNQRCNVTTQSLICVEQ